MCREFSQCYSDVNICLWTNGSDLSQSDAHTACQQRNKSFLPRVTDDNIQSKLAQFRSQADNDTGRLIHGQGFWIDVKQVDEGFQWIDGSSLAGLSALATERIFNVISIYQIYCKNDK